MSESAEQWMQEARAAGEQAREQESDDAALPPIRALDLDNLPPLRPELIEGVLRCGHIMVFGGSSKAGKTQSLIELAVAIATGGRWFGFQCRQGRVLYVDGETDPASFAHRFKGVSDRLAADSAQIAANIDIWNLRGYTEGLQFLEPQIVDRATGRNYDVLILDPAYKVMDGDENSARDVGEFCNALDKLAHKLNCTVIYDHHHSKGAQGDKASEDRVSGSGVFSRHADAIVDLLRLVPTDEQQAEAGAERDCSAFRVSMTLREFAPAEPFNVWFQHPVHVRDYEGVLDEWEPMTAARAGGRSTAQRTKLETLGKISKIETIVDEMMVEARAKQVKRNEVATRYGASRHTVDKLIDASKKYMRESGVNECWIIPRR